MHDVIGQALAQYGIDGADARLTLLRHNENRTYRVEYGDASFCLRLKSPVAGFDTSVLGGRPDTLLAGELALISAVARQTDIPVQRPLQTLSGQAAARLPDGTLASLLSWLDGTPINRGPRTEQMLFGAGQTLAKLANAGQAAPGLGGFARLRYDKALLQRLAAQARQGDTYLPAGVVDSMLRALDAIGRTLDEMDGGQAILLAHADPGLGNLIWTGQAVGLIDWSLSGYAYAPLDIGFAMGATPDRDEQRWLLRGWESLRGPVNRAHLDAYFALSVLLFVCCQYRRAGQWTDWFPAALTRWQQTIFDPLAAGQALTCIL